MLGNRYTWKEKERRTKEKVLGCWEEDAMEEDVGERYTWEEKERTTKEKVQGCWEEDAWRRMLRIDGLGRMKKGGPKRRFVDQLKDMCVVC